MISLVRKRSSLRRKRTRPTRFRPPKRSLFLKRPILSSNTNNLLHHPAETSRPRGEVRITILIHSIILSQENLDHKMLCKLDDQTPNLIASYLNYLLVISNRILALWMWEKWDHSVHLASKKWNHAVIHSTNKISRSRTLTWETLNSNCKAHLRAVNPSTIKIKEWITTLHFLTSHRDKK